MKKFAILAIMIFLASCAGMTNTVKEIDQGLVRAACKGDVKLVKVLLDNGANVDARDNRGRTGLIWAAFKNQDEVVKLLLESGADTEIRDDRGCTALVWALRNAHTEIVEMLLKYRTK